MKAEKIAVLATEIINLFFTSLFFILFIRRMLRILPMGLTNKYSDTAWLKRCLIAGMYIIVSATMLAIELVEHKEKVIVSVITSGIIGFCVNSFVLVMHILVVKRQIDREIPFTILHQQFLAYVLVICSVRLGILIYLTLQAQSIYNQILVSLAAAEELISGIMFIYWMKNRKALHFEDYKKVDADTITSKLNLPLLLDFSSMGTNRSSIDRCQLIKVNVSFEKDEIRIILQTYTDDNVLKNLTNDQTSQVSRFQTSNSRQQHLQIISDHRYSIKNLQKIYLTCCRFDITSKIDFSGSVSKQNFYRQVKYYMQELFSLKQVYCEQILKLFHIESQQIQDFTTKIRSLTKNLEDLQYCNFSDRGALFLSIKFTKTLWVGDHFIFYIFAKTSDQHQHSITYKRYSDFQQFHSKLQNLISQQYKNTYILPEIPKKHFFALGQNQHLKADQRRKQLEMYCRQTFNDYEIMTKMHRARELIFDFLGLVNTLEIKPNEKSILSFYEGLQIEKGEIYQALVEEEYVTFYEFLLVKNGEKTFSIFKRFKNFVQLHQVL